MTDPKTVTVQERLVDKLEAIIDHKRLRHVSSRSIAKVVLETLQSERASMEGARECSICHATVARTTKGMCCHCVSVDWPLKPALTSSKTGDER